MVPPTPPLNQGASETETSAPVAAKSESMGGSFHQDTNQLIVAVHSLDEVWRSPWALNHGRRHALAIRRQLSHLYQQPREHPYYKLLSAIVQHLTNLYIDAIKPYSRLDIEFAPQAMLLYQTELSSMAVDIRADPTFHGTDLLLSITPESILEQEPQTACPSRVRRSDPYWIRELKGLEENAKNFIRSFKGRGEPSRTVATGEELDMTPTPEPETRSEVFYRIADGIAYLQDGLSDSATPLPALVMEMKVPVWHSSLPSNQRRSWVINRNNAETCITKALPQIIQQVQLVLHNYAGLSSIWACGIAGRWIRFMRFTRSALPPIDLMKITQKDPYCAALLPEDAEQRIIAHLSELFAIQDEDGNYTETFKRYWHIAMLTAAQQYDDVEPLADAAAEERDEKILNQVFTQTLGDIGHEETHHDRNHPGRNADADTGGDNTTHTDTETRGNGDGQRVEEPSGGRGSGGAQHSRAERESRGTDDQGGHDEGKRGAENKDAAHS